MDDAELLAQLRDIHLPEAVGLWPAAAGWWILAGLLAAITVIGLILGLRALHQRRRWRRVLRELSLLRRSYVRASAVHRRAVRRGNHTAVDTEAIGSLQLRYMNQVNTLLRRVALFHYPDSGVGGLSGGAWIDFIRATGDATRLDDDLARGLGFGRFQTHCEVDTEALYAMARVWISSVYRQQGLAAQLGAQLESRLGSRLSSQPSGGSR